MGVQLLSKPLRALSPGQRSSKFLTDKARCVPLSRASLRMLPKIRVYHNDTRESLILRGNAGAASRG